MESQIYQKNINRQSTPSVKYGLQDAHRNRSFHVTGARCWQSESPRWKTLPGHRIPVDGHSRASDVQEILVLTSARRVCDITVRGYSGVPSVDLKGSLLGQDAVDNHTSEDGATPRGYYRMASTFIVQVKNCLRGSAPLTPKLVCQQDGQKL